MEQPVFLYAGQGSQFVGMGKDFYEAYPEYRHLVDGMEDVEGMDRIRKTMMEGPEEILTLTENTQPAMALFAAGVTEVLKARGIRPAAACGLSLGEYGALYAAGVWDAKTYVKITAFRGKAMTEASGGISCSMSAVLNLSAKQVEDCCERVCRSLGEEHYVTVTNYNCPGQYVISGDLEAVEEAERLCREAGARRCLRLKVSAPFHTKYLRKASQALAEFFADIPFAEPQIPVALNTTGELAQKGQIKDCLIRQASSGVRFEEDLKTLMNLGYDSFVEIGPGNVLAGFCRKTARELGKKVSVTSIQTVEDMESLF